MSVALIFGNDRLILDPSGALYWPEEQLLVVADLHFEKGSSFAASAFRPLPPHDTVQTLGNLASVINTYQPRRVICLGDSFHDRHAPARLSPPDFLKLQSLVVDHDWIWIVGNHDPVLPEIVGGTVARAVEISGIIFQHDPIEETGQRSPRIVFGHYHPAALVSLAGRLVRRRCFVIGSRRLLIPAFGSYAGGLNILSPVILDQFPGGYKVLLLERNRLYNIQIQHLRPDSNLALSRKLSD